MTLPYRLKCINNYRQPWISTDLFDSLFISFSTFSFIWCLIFISFYFIIIFFIILSYIYLSWICYLLPLHVQFRVFYLCKKFWTNLSIKNIERDIKFRKQRWQTKKRLLFTILKATPNKSQSRWLKFFRFFRFFFLFSLLKINDSTDRCATLTLWIVSHTYLCISLILRQSGKSSEMEDKTISDLSNQYANEY